MRLMFLKKLIFTCILFSLSLNTFAQPLTTPKIYCRGPDQTYLTFPEWFIVYISEDYAQAIKDSPPSEFPYFKYIGQFWKSYYDVYAYTNARYPINWGYNIMIVTIGISTTLEYGLKGIYENTIGWITEKSSTHGLTQEDIFAYQTAQEYVDFIKVRPWYEFNYLAKIKQLWSTTCLQQNDIIRQLERKVILSMEYSFKAGYGWIIKKLTLMSYGEESALTVVLVDNLPNALLQNDQSIKLLKQVDKNTQLIALPRYDAFKVQASKLAVNGITFHEIAGNSGNILLSFKVPKGWQYNLPNGKVLFSQNILISNVGEVREVIEVPVSKLNRVLNELNSQKISVEHLYDY